MRRATKQALRAERAVRRFMEERAHEIGRTITFAGSSAAGLLPFGSTWETSDGFTLQCVNVGHNVRETGHYIGTARVIGFAQRVLRGAGTPSTTTGRAVQPAKPE